MTTSLKASPISSAGRRVLASSDDGLRLGQMAEEIARMVNPQCWFLDCGEDPRSPEHRADLQALLNAQAALLEKAIVPEYCPQWGIG